MCVKMNNVGVVGGRHSSRKVTKESLGLSVSRSWICCLISVLEHQSWDDTQSMHLRALFESNDKRVTV